MINPALAPTAKPADVGVRPPLAILPERFRGRWGREEDGEDLHLCWRWGYREREIRMKGFPISYPGFQAKEAGDLLALFRLFPAGRRAAAEG